MYADRQMSPARAKFHDKEMRVRRERKFSILKCPHCGEVNKIHRDVRNARCWLCERLF